MVDSQTAPYAALLLRLWGIRYGLPFAYNIDERSHFVPRAVGLFTKGTFDPHYHPILAMNDTGEQPNNAAILTTQYGRGTYVYVTLALFSGEGAQIQPLAGVSCDVVL